MEPRANAVSRRSGRALWAVAALAMGSGRRVAAQQAAESAIPSYVPPATWAAQVLNAETGCTVRTTAEAAVDFVGVHPDDANVKCWRTYALATPGGEVQALHAGNNADIGRGAVGERARRQQAARKQKRVQFDCRIFVLCEHLAGGGHRMVHFAASDRHARVSDGAKYSLGWCRAGRRAA